MLHWGQVTPENIICGSVKTTKFFSVTCHLWGGISPYRIVLFRNQEAASLCTFLFLCCTPDAPCKGQPAFRNMDLGCKDLLGLGRKEKHLF